MRRFIPDGPLFADLCPHGFDRPPWLSVPFVLPPRVDITKYDAELVQRLDNEIGP